MGFLKNIIRNAVSDGISKGIRDAVSSAAEKIVAPQAEAYANKAADSLITAAQNIDEAAVSAALASAAANAGANTAMTPAFLREWAEKLPGFPAWCFGGKDFSLDENFVSEDGGTVFYYFNAEGATAEEMQAYVNILKSIGFVQKYKDSDATLFKDLGGSWLVFSTVEAFNDLDVMSVGMGHTNDNNQI